MEQTKIGNLTMKKISLHIAILIFSLLSINLFGQVKFYVKASNTAYLDQAFNITYVLENVSNGDFNVPTKIEGFELIGGPSTSSSYSNMNGQVSSVFSKTYYYQALKEGVFTIPKLSLKLKGKVYESQEIKVTVKKGNPQQNTTQQNTRQPNNIPQQRQGQNEDFDWQKEVAKGIFIKMYVDNDKPFAGEQINVYVKLYQKINTAGLNLVEMPNFDGFWKNEFEISDDPWKQEQANGVWYQTKIIAKFALFPLRAGEFKISPMKLQTAINLRVPANTGNPFFDQFMSNYEQKIYDFQSNALTIKAKELPLEGKPENFSGAVGQFKFTASLDSTKTETYKAINLKTNLTGTGNIMMLTAPELYLDESIEVFDPEEKEYISTRSSTINGTKKYTYAIVPNKPGVFKIPALEFSFFDTKTKTYKTVYTDSLSLIVNKSADYKEEKIAEAEDSTSQKIDFIEIKFTEDFVAKNTNNFSESKKFTALLASPALLTLLLFFIKKRKENYVPDLIAANRKKANKLALQKLKQAAILLKANDQKGFYNEVIRSLWNYVSLKLNIEPENLSKDNIQEKLLAQNVNEETAKEYIEVIKSCEMALYSSIERNQMQQDFDSAKELIIKLEDVL